MGFGSRSVRRRATFCTRCCARPWWSACGIAAGLWVTAAKLSVIGSFAYAGDISNAPLFALIAAFMFGVAGLAAYIPARRATLVDPTESLCSE